MLIAIYFHETCKLNFITADIFIHHEFGRQLCY